MRRASILLNVGETHYPFALPGETRATWPRLSACTAFFSTSTARWSAVGLRDSEPPPEFDQAQLDRLRARQIEAVRYLDGVFERLFDLLPANTYITVTADHGELFGEGGYFGHGPIQHDLVFEVPLMEGKLR